MKQQYLAFFLFSFLLFNVTASRAQVNLPYTLTFSSNDVVNWTDGIASDGEGGAANINGLDLRIYTAGNDHSTLYPGSTILWWDNTYFYSSTSTYNGITSGPDEEATNNGVPAMVIKSADQAVNFSLQSIQLYDWGYDNIITIETYDNNIRVGSIDFIPSPDWYALTISQSDILTPGFFNNIDEIRFFPKAPNTIFNLSMNNISLAAAATVLPVTFSSINAKRQADDIAIEWKVANETGIEKYEVERSADGQAFTIIGTKNAPGNQISATYNWLDENVLSGNNFYRVSSTGITGKKQYSSIVKVHTGNAKPVLTVYPNPSTNGKVSLLMKNMPEGIYQAKLINPAGQIMLTKRITHAAGNTNEPLNFSKLPKGIYVLEINYPDHTSSQSTIVY